jgi:hypothetical protein
MAFLLFKVTLAPDRKEKKKARAAIHPGETEQKNLGL